MATDIYAVARHIPISAQKVRLVADLVRGKDVVEALTMLRFTTNFAAKPVSKIIASAMANGEEISIPLHLFGDEASFSLDAQSNTTYSLSIYPLHFLPNEKHFRNQVEESKDGKTFVFCRHLFSYGGKTKEPGQLFELAGLRNDVKMVAIGLLRAFSGKPDNFY
jgi:hypothetical protein